MRANGPILSCFCPPSSIRGTYFKAIKLSSLILLIASIIMLIVDSVHCYIEANKTESFGDLVEYEKRNIIISSSILMLVFMFGIHSVLIESLTSIVVYFTVVVSIIVTKLFINQHNFSLITLAVYLLQAVSIFMVSIYLKLTETNFVFVDDQDVESN